MTARSSTSGSIAKFLSRTQMVWLSISVFPIAFLWWRLIDHLRVEWTLNAQYNYCWVVPFQCAYFAWQRWRDRNSATQLGNTAPHSSILPASVIVGFFVVLALLYAPTRLVEEANPEWRLVSWALAFEVVGLTLLTIRWFFGPERLKQVAFPICFFFVAIPWPTLIEAPLIQQLTRANASATVELLGILNVPAVRLGNTIEIANGVVGVEEACSGIRSVHAALMVSLFLGEMYRLDWTRRIALVWGGFALSFVFNVARTFTLVSVAARDGLPAIDRWHDPAGWTLLGLCFLSLWGLGAWMQHQRREEAEHDSKSLSEKGARLCRRPAAGRGEESNAPTIRDPLRLVEDDTAAVRTFQTGSKSDTNHERRNPPGKSGTQFIEGRRPADNHAKIESAAFSARHPSSDSTLRPLKRTQTPRWLPWSLAIWIIVTETGVEAWYRVHESDQAPGATWTVKWPTQAATFNERSFSEKERRFLRFDEGRNGAWIEPDGTRWHMIFLRWNAGATATHLARNHTPEVCLTAAGHELTNVSDLEPIELSGIKLPFRHYVMGPSSGNGHVFYCLWQDGNEHQSSEKMSLTYRNRLASVSDGLRNRGQRSIEIAIWGIDDPAKVVEIFRQRLAKLVVTQSSL